VALDDEVHIVLKKARKKRKLLRIMGPCPSNAVAPPWEGGYDVTLTRADKDKNMILAAWELEQTRDYHLRLCGDALGR
jgi:hypothetical protein